MTSTITDDELKWIQALRVSGIPGNLQEWARGNSDKIKEIFSYKGGWEVWAQSELCYWFQHNMFGGRNLEILREQQIYAGSTLQTKKADMVIRSKGVPKAQGGVYIIEFKTERGNDLKALEGDVVVDNSKLENFAGIKPDQWGDTIAGVLYSIVMVVTEDGVQMMQKQYEPKGYIRNRERIGCKDGSELHVWVREVQFKKT